MTALSNKSNNAIALTQKVPDHLQHIVSKEALAFISALTHQFRPQIQQCLKVREEKKHRIEQGASLDFLKETKSIRESEWKVAPIPYDLQDRRVEITGPVERKMVINALNSGAKVFMADFEDAHSPTWIGTLEGQQNMMDAVRRTISFESSEGKQYKLNPTIAALLVRPRGLHLVEKHCLVDGETVPGCLFDFGLYVFHNAHELIKRNTGPYFYIPKLQSHLEARLWDQIFTFSEKALGLTHGVMKATVLIETIHAAFEMEEILYELKDHIVGLNCGRWDYIFSFIKTFSSRPNWIFPDRASVTMTSHFLRSYTQLLIKTCHKRGAFAMGGMSAFIPVKDNVEQNERALTMVREDKTREATDGHDGTWVAHPGLIPAVLEIFDRIMPTPNQVSKTRDDVHVTAKDLLTLPAGDITEQGLRNNISVALQYLANWLDGKGCVPIFNLMEDAATAEISRTQLWQWVHYKAKTADGTIITKELVQQFTDEELVHLLVSPAGQSLKQHYEQAAAILLKLVNANHCPDFLTLVCYDYII